MGADAEPDAPGREARRRRGVIDRVIASYGGVRREMRRLLEERPSEAVILSFLMIWALFSFMGAFAELSALPRDPSDLAAEDRFKKELFERFIGAFFIAPLGVYIVAALCNGLLRLFGGAGGGYETRLAFAWALVAATPLLMAGSLLDATAISLSGGAAAGGSALGAPFSEGDASMGVLFVLAWLAAAGVVYLISACLAEAHGFRSSAPIMGAVLGVVAVVTAIVLAVRPVVG